MSKNLDSAKRVSVVVNTLNRADQLNKCLNALSAQNYPNFEVIIVNGPSTDETEAIISRFDASAHVVRIKEKNLSKSRNAGIRASSGEIVAFIDDDAYAEPGWVENIVAGYNNDRVGAVGTRVWDISGFAEQLNPRLIDKYYRPIFEWGPPLWAFEYNRSQTIPHILGASCSFRASVIEAVGGFDEEIEYFLDESEVCRRIVELGYTIDLLETGPAVHHKYATGVIRDERKIVLNPYPVVKNYFYVNLRDCRTSGGSIGETVDVCERFAQRLSDDARGAYESSTLTHEELDTFQRMLERGRVDGIERGLKAERKSGSFGRDRIDSFRPFISSSRKMNSYVFVSRILPQESPGGVAQFLHDLALGFARAGNVVHIITKDDLSPGIDFESGVWLHKLSTITHDFPNEYSLVLQSSAAKANFQWSRLVHQEIERMKSNGLPVDLIVCPIWDAEGLHCILDPSLKTVLTLQTTFDTYAKIEGRYLDQTTRTELSCIEQLTISNSTHVHAISEAILEQVRSTYQEKSGSLWKVAHLGIKDITQNRRALATSFRHPVANGVRLLFVSRLEPRKGVDVFFDACLRLIESYPELQINMVGRDPFKGDHQRSIAERFMRNNPHVLRNFIFHGEVDNASLIEAYENADIFCVPSRFESFGLIYVEAMRSSLPVVACRVGGVPEIVLDEETGLLVEPNNAKALCAALDSLIRNPDRRTTLGLAGRRRYESFFTSDQMVARTLEMYEQFIEDWRSGQ
jgi:hypothetical protein